MMRKHNSLFFKGALLGALFLMPAFARAQDKPTEITFRNEQPAKLDSKGRKIETIETDRKITLGEDGLLSSKEYREKLAEDERLRKLAKECGEWFERVQLLDAKKPGGMLAYIEAMRIFKVSDAVRREEGRAASQLKASLDEMLRRRGGEIMVGPGHGVSIDDPMELLLLRYQSNLAQSTPVKELKPAKSADLWPGPVAKEAQRVTKKVYLNSAVGGWLSTGLYAPPGEVIRIRALTLGGGDNLRVQIGCHSDKLDPQIMALKEGGGVDKEAPINLMAVKMGWQEITDNRSLWRWPDCVRSFKITKRKAEVGFALGGMLYFQYSAGKSGKIMEVEVSGCVEAPRFRLGIDTNDDWNTRLSKLPAPWGELETKNVILTFPSNAARNVTNMLEVAQWWGKATAMQYRLSGRKLATDFGKDHLPRPERLVDDTQISIGAGHSGYPIMHMGWSGGMLNLRSLKAAGNWGSMHEIGHNMGQGANGVYTIPGNIEVICNFYGTFVMNKLNGTSLRRIHAESWKNVAAKINGSAYGWAQAQVFERLVFYMTLADYFGWDPFLEAVNDTDKIPKECDQPVDPLLVRLSKSTGRDLTPYFDMWKLRYSKGAARFTSKFPPWPVEEEKAKLFEDDPYAHLDGESSEVRAPSDPCDVKTKRQLRNSGSMNAHTDLNH